MSRLQFVPRAHLRAAWFPHKLKIGNRTDSRVRVCFLHCGEDYSQWIHVFHSECQSALIFCPQNAFVQLSLAFRNDNYTLETRLKQAERERNLTEEDTEKELEDFKGALKVSPRKQIEVNSQENKKSPRLFSAHSSI